MIIILLRTFFFYFTTICAMRLMGKRQIGELEPSELVVTILISELATIPMQDIDAPLIYALIPIFALVAFEMFSSVISTKSTAFRTFISGGYSVIIDNGIIDQKEMRKNQLTLDELMEEIRQGGAVSVDEVRLCVLETSGKMSVLLKKETQSRTIPIPVVIDGRCVKANMKKLGFNKKTLSEKIKENGVSRQSEIFWMSISGSKVCMIKKDET